MSLKEGDIISFERTFTTKDVAIFTEVSGDEGTHHKMPDEGGRLVIQGLLTATLPTKIGGDYSVLARDMHFTFLRPVFTGDTISCEVKMEQVDNQDKEKTKLIASFICHNQHGKKVLRGSFSGIIRK